MGRFLEFEWSRKISIPLDAVSIVINEQQKKALGNQISSKARGFVLNNIQRGLFMSSPKGSSLIKAPPYSRKKLILPTTRISREERAPTRSSRYAKIMRRVESQLGTQGIGTRTDKKNKRKWVRLRGGYQQLKMMAGLGTEDNMRFTGKMLEDFRVRVRISTNPETTKRAMTDMINEGYAQIFASSRRSSGGKNITRQANLPNRPRDNKHLSLMQILVDFGFSTRSSLRIATFHHKSVNRRRRIFAGLPERPDLVNLSAFTQDKVARALNDERFSGKGAEGRIPQPRDKGGRFMKLHY